MSSIKYTPGNGSQKVVIAYSRFKCLYNHVFVSVLKMNKKEFYLQWTATPLWKLHSGAWLLGVYVAQGLLGSLLHIRHRMWCTSHSSPILPAMWHKACGIAGAHLLKNVLHVPILLEHLKEKKNLIYLGNTI